MVHALRIRHARSSSQRNGRNLFVLLLLGAPWTLAGWGHAINTDTDGAGAPPEVAALHRAASRLATPHAASVAGYVEARACAGNETSSRLIHYVDPLLLGDSVVAIARPHILMYGPGPTGGWRLRAVAYRVDQRTWHGDGHGLRPHLFGRPFELVERTGEGSFYQLIVGVMTVAAPDALVERISIGTCGHAER